MTERERILRTDAIRFAGRILPWLIVTTGNGVESFTDNSVGGMEVKH
ncbi:MAG: hypothetical protein PHV61_04065 [Limnochordia bacterium]|jgi:hypothetical protein|nr:hypothetical protein [Limnochordia bacterium]MDD2629329.1 hypothetical protein [Limnochordia bacterium]MDD4518072.1 hypothetical protein [Limnochordia bacterium]